MHCRLLLPSLPLSPCSDSPWFPGEGVALATKLGLAQMPAKLEGALSNDGILALNMRDSRFSMRGPARKI